VSQWKKWGRIPSERKVSALPPEKDILSRRKTKTERIKERGEVERRLRGGKSRSRKLFLACSKNLKRGKGKLEEAKFPARPSNCLLLKKWELPEKDKRGLTPATEE